MPRLAQQPFAAFLVAEGIALRPEAPNGRVAVRGQLNGYRALLRKRDKDVRLRSRNDRDLSGAYRRVIASGRKLQPRAVLLDARARSDCSPGSCERSEQRMGRGVDPAALRKTSWKL